MAITDSCAAGRVMPRTRNQSKYIHSYTLRLRVYRQTFENYNVVNNNALNKDSHIDKIYVCNE